MIIIKVLSIPQKNKILNATLNNVAERRNGNRGFWLFQLSFVEEDNFLEFFLQIQNFQAFFVLQRFEFFFVLNGFEQREKIKRQL